MIQRLQNPPPTVLTKLLWRWQNKGADIFTAQQDKKHEIQSLLESGWIRPMADAEWYDCECGGCGEVQIMESPTHGTLYHVNCDGCGISRVEQWELRQWEIIVPVFVKRIAEALGFVYPCGVTVPNGVWHLGRRKNREYFLVRKVHWTERKLFQDTFGNKKAAILIVPTRSDVHQMKEYLPNDTFSLEELLFPSSELALQSNMDLIDAGVQETSVPKKPVRRRGSRLADIEKLTDELKLYYRESKASYDATGELLPCLTQSDLARLTKLSQQTISRCLNDPDATVLQLLWKNQADTRFVLNH